MSNSRSFRRKLKGAQHVRPSGQEQQPGRYSKGHVPWNKGLALTTRPSLGTVRRWLESCVDEGWAERKTAEPDGTRRGRPPVMYRVTEKGLAQPRTPPEVEKMEWERLRRWENAKKRQRTQRNAQRRSTLEGKVARAERKLKAATDAYEQAQAKLLTMELVIGGIKALAEADGGTAVLHPEEVDALVETGCAIRKGDGVLSLAEDCLEAFDRITA
jgi:DNA-binding PadR family transcriptional regulator